MVSLQDFSAAQIHVYTAGQARIKAPHGAHDVYPFEFVRAVLLEDRRILDRVLVGPRSTINVPRIGIPWRRWIRMIVRDLASADHHMMRKHTPHGFVEAAANSFFRHLEIRPGSSPSRVQF